MNGFFKGHAILGIIDSSRRDDGGFEMYGVNHFGFEKEGCMTAAFDVYDVRPGMDRGSAEEFFFNRLDDMLECEDPQYKLELCEKYDCSPRDVAEQWGEDILSDYGDDVFDAIKNEFGDYAYFSENEPIIELVGGGQADKFDSIIYPIADEAVIADVRYLWSTYHLNDMNPGTPKQMEAIEKAGLRGAGYDMVVKYLQEIGLYEDEWNGEPYVYGTGWLKFDVPANDTKRIAETIDALESLSNPEQAAKMYMDVQQQM